MDISENNMVELVRDIRSSVGYGGGEFATFALDCGSEIFRAFINEQKKRIGGYDYVFMARDDKEFEEYLARAIEDYNNIDARRRLLEQAEENTWNKRAKDIIEALK